MTLNEIKRLENGIVFVGKNGIPGFKRIKRDKIGC